MSSIKIRPEDNQQKIKEQQKLIRSLEQEIRERCQSYLIQINTLKKKQQKNNHYKIHQVIQINLHLHHQLSPQYQHELESLDQQQPIKIIDPQSLPSDIIQSFKERISHLQSSKNTAIKQLRVFMAKCQEQEQEILNIKQSLIKSQKQAILGDSEGLLNKKYQRAIQIIIESQLSDMASIQSQYIASIKDPIQKANLIAEKLKNYRNSQSCLESEIKTYHAPLELDETKNIGIQGEGQINKLIKQQQQIERLNKQLKLQKEDVKNLLEQNERLKKLIDILQNSRDEAIRLRQNVQRQYKELELQFVKQKNMMDQMSQLNKILQDQKLKILQDQKVRNVQMNEPLIDTFKLERQTSNLFSQFNERQNSLKQNIQTIQAQKNELKLQLQTLKQEMKKSNDLNAKLNNQIEAIQFIKFSKQNQIQKLQQKINQLQSNHPSEVQLIEKYTFLQKENARLKQQLQIKNQFTKKPYNQSLQPYIIEEDLGDQFNNEYVKRRFIRKTVIRRNLSAMTFRSVSKTKKQTIENLQKRIETMKTNQGSPNDKQQMERFARKISSLKRSLQNDVVEEASKEDSQNRNSGSVSESSNDQNINIVELRTDIPIRSIYNAKIVENKKIPEVQRINRLYNFNKKDKNDKKGGSGLL